MLMTPEMPPTMRRAPEREEASFIVRAGLLLAMRHHSLAVSHAAFSFSVALIDAVRLVLLAQGQAVGKPSCPREGVRLFRGRAAPSVLPWFGSRGEGDARRLPPPAIAPDVRLETLGRRSWVYNERDG